MKKILAVIILSAAVTSCGTLYDEWLEDSGEMKPVQWSYLTDSANSPLPTGDQFKLVPCGGKLFAVIATSVGISLYYYDENISPYWFNQNNFDTTGGAFDAVCHDGQITAANSSGSKYNYFRYGVTIPTIDVITAPVSTDLKLTVYNGKLYVIYKANYSGQGFSADIYKASRLKADNTWEDINSDPDWGIYLPQVAQSESDLTDLKVASDSTGIYTLFSTNGNVIMHKFTSGWSRIYGYGGLPYIKQAVKYNLTAWQGKVYVSTLNSNMTHTDIYQSSLLKWEPAGFGINTASPGTHIQNLIVNGKPVVLELLIAENSSVLYGEIFFSDHYQWYPLIGGYQGPVINTNKFHGVEFDNKLYIIFPSVGGPQVIVGR